MRKELKTRQIRPTRSMGTLGALTLSFSLAAFGCSSNLNRANGEPDMDINPTGSVTAPASTPGTAVSTPPPMVSAAVDPTVDAVAVMKANEGFQGKVLGPASPGAQTQGASMQQVTGQFQPPSAVANPQITVNSSISSGAVPALPAGDVGGGALVAVPSTGTGLTAAGTIAPAGTTVGTTSAATNGGVVSPAINAGVVSPAATNTVTSAATNTSTGLTNGTSSLTNVGSGNNTFVGTGLVAAPSAMSSALATPVAGPAVGTTNTIATTPRANEINAVAPVPATATTARTAAGTTARTGTTTTTTNGTVRLTNSDGRVVISNSTAPGASVKVPTATVAPATQSTTSTTTTSNP